MRTPEVSIYVSQQEDGRYALSRNYKSEIRAALTRYATEDNWAAVFPQTHMEMMENITEQVMQSLFSSVSEFSQRFADSVAQSTDKTLISNEFSFVPAGYTEAVSVRVGLKDASQSE